MISDSIWLLSAGSEDFPSSAGAGAEAETEMTIRRNLSYEFYYFSITDKRMGREGAELPCNREKSGYVTKKYGARELLRLFDIQHCLSKLLYP